MPTPGTAVQLSTTAVPCSQIHIETPLSNTGTVWIGTAGLTGSTLTKVIHQLIAPASGEEPNEIDFGFEDGNNALDLRDLWIDTAVAGEGALVTYWTA